MLIDLPAANWLRELILKTSLIIIHMKRDLLTSSILQTVHHKLQPADRYQLQQSL